MGGTKHFHNFSQPYRYDELIITLQIDIAIWFSTNSISFLYAIFVLNVDNKDMKWKMQAYV